METSATGRGAAGGDPEVGELAHAPADALRVEPRRGGDVEVLEPLRVGRERGVVAPRGGEQRGDHALELAEVTGVDRPRAVDPLAAEHPAHPRGERVVLARHAVAVGLRPDGRLAVGDPRAAHVEVEPARARRAAPTRGRRSGRAPPAPSPCSRAPRAHGRRRGR